MAEREKDRYQNQGDDQESGGGRGRGGYRGSSERKYLFTRHSKKVNKGEKGSERYPGLSNEGVELARKQAVNILRDVEEAEPGTVLFLGGATDQPRTVSTARIYGEEMKKLVGDNKGYAVFTYEDLQGIKDKGELKRLIDENADKKVILTYPQEIKSLSLVERGWQTKEGKANAYYEMLAKKFPGDDYAQLKHWIETRGVEGKIRGPSPDVVARGYEKAAHRLERGIRELVGDRPAITGFVGHSFEIDTYLAYLAGNGKIDLESLEKVEAGGGMVKETEKAFVTVRQEEGITEVNYRGKKHAIKHALEDIVGMLAIGGAFLCLISATSITGNAVGASSGGNSLTWITAFLTFICGALWLLVRKK